MYCRVFLHSNVTVAPILMCHIIFCHRHHVLMQTNKRKRFEDELCVKLGLCLFFFYYCSSILCSRQSVGNLNLGTLDAVDFILLYVLFCQAFSTSWFDKKKKGSFNICVFFGVFFSSLFFSFLCVCFPCHLSID